MLMAGALTGCPNGGGPDDGPDGTTYTETEGISSRLYEFGTLNITNISGNNCQLYH